MSTKSENLIDRVNFDHVTKIRGETCPVFNISTVDLDQMLESEGGPMSTFHHLDEEQRNFLVIMLALTAGGDNLSNVDVNMIMNAIARMTNFLNYYDRFLADTHHEHGAFLPQDGLKAIMYNLLYEGEEEEEADEEEEEKE